MAELTSRVALLSDALSKAADARAMCHSNVWADAWNKFEQELFQQLLDCGPDEDVKRYRLQIAIDASRQARRTIEHQGRTIDSLETQLAVLTGEKKLRIA